jgi:hypothetical protein
MTEPADGVVFHALVYWEGYEDPADPFHVDVIARDRDDARQKVSDTVTPHYLPWRGEPIRIDVFTYDEWLDDPRSRDT